MEKVTSQREALVFLLKRLYDAEQEVHGMLPEFISQVSSTSLKVSLWKYQQEEENKMTRFEELFEFLNEPACNKRHQHIFSLLRETKDRLSDTTRGQEKDQLLLTRLQTINDYKISDYIACHHFANELGEVGAAAILKVMLEKERELGWQLAQLETSSVTHEVFGLEE